jgi:adenylate cyclase
MIELLSEYYARMTEQIFAYEGMLKEYVGDELLAIFGAPIAQPDHAERACATALLCESIVTLCVLSGQSSVVHP